MTIVQKAVIQALLTDTGVQTALGFTFPKQGGVAEAKSFNLTGATYPFVAVGVMTEKPREVEQIASMAGKRISDTYVDVTIFSKKTTSSQIGDIDESVRTLLDGGLLNYTGLACYLCEFDSLISKDRDPDTDVWHLTTRYKVIARPT